MRDFSFHSFYLSYFCCCCAFSTNTHTHIYLQPCTQHFALKWRWSKSVNGWMDGWKRRKSKMKISFAVVNGSIWHAFYMLKVNTFIWFMCTHHILFLFDSLLNSIFLYVLWCENTEMEIKKTSSLILCTAQDATLATGP